MFERFRRDPDDEPARSDRTDTIRTTQDRRGTVVEGVRGGVSFGAILTGVVVAFGAMFILSALITGILVALGLQEGDVTAGDAVNAGIGAGIALVVAQFLAYMWGGYTAGRMGRGAGIANGLLVPLIALIVAVLVAAVVTAVGANADADLSFRVTLPFSPQALYQDEALQDWGIGLGIAALIAMFLGGALGGGLGSRWHTKLERHQYEEGYEGTRPIDLREERRVPTGTGARTTSESETEDTPPPPR